MVGLNTKHLDNHSLPALLEILRNNQQKVVFTNGCFDILHPGHVDYLSKAKALGDVLLVAVNDDHSVKKLKGNTRPIHTLEDRMSMLAALESVDFVVSFSEDTPLELIQKINPEFLVKGGDYLKEDIVGATHVESYGGKVSIISFLEGYSTSTIIDRIKNS